MGIKGTEGSTYLRLLVKCCKFEQFLASFNLTRSRGKHAMTSRIFICVMNLNYQIVRYFFTVMNWMQPASTSCLSTEMLKIFTAWVKGSRKSTILVSDFYFCFDRISNHSLLCTYSKVSCLKTSLQYFAIILLFILILEM